MPSFDKLENMTAELLDERRLEINALLGMYNQQISKDYQACRLDKEKLILLSHLSLSQQQSIEILELNLQLARVMESSQIHLNRSVESQVMLKTCKMEKHICEMLDQNRKLLRDSSLQEACDYITPYDVQDVKRGFEPSNSNLKRPW